MIDVFLLCFTMILDTLLLNSCSKAAPAALGGCGGLGQLWEALAELWEALGELWEGLYIQKLPINRPSGRYANGCYFKLICEASDMKKKKRKLL